MRTMNPTEAFLANGSCTELAMALEIAMAAASDETRAAYLAIYGHAWEPLDLTYDGRVNYSGESTTSNTAAL